ncbi:hypothetical protein [Absidia glauca]|uniref:Uncharacterized protein n=1 Tax=Absidia glauca TaxID=4829 RepID=A0A168QT38_ABSGL|nr:hypothetical protein [Absidia glauca]
MDNTAPAPAQSPSGIDEKQKFNADEMTAIIKEQGTFLERDHCGNLFEETTLSEQQLQIHRSVYWDNLHDGSASYRHETKSLYAITNVFALSV